MRREEEEDVKIFIDTANLNEIKKAKALGLVDGVTTNPTLLAKEGEETEALIRKISEEVKGPVNVEVTGTTCEEMVKEAKVMATWGDEIVIKIPITPGRIKNSQDPFLRRDPHECDTPLLSQPGHFGCKGWGHLCLSFFRKAR